MKQKFEIGDKVKLEAEPDGEISEVLAFTFDGDKYLYKLSSKVIDMKKKELHDAVKFCKQDELEKVEDKE